MHHYNVMMRAISSQITEVSIVYSTVCSGVHRRKHQSSASLAFLRRIQRWPVNSPLKGPVTRKCFHLMRSLYRNAVQSAWNISYKLAIPRSPNPKSRGPPTGCHHCGQTLTIDHMLLECALLQEYRDEYYTVDSLNALFETIPETCIVEFLREAGFFNLIWCNLLISTSPQTWTIWSDLSNCLENESNSETHLLM